MARNYLEKTLGVRCDENCLNISDFNEDDEDFFTFKESKEVESAQEELERFLKSKSSNIEMLHDFGIIKKFFLKYNTALPSSASVERMFSVGGSVITPQRGHMNDDIIEHQILLKINKTFY